MSEMYKEQLVKRRKDKKDVTIKFTMSFATILSICIFFFFPIGIIIPIILAIVDVVGYLHMLLDSYRILFYKVHTML